MPDLQSGVYPTVADSLDESESIFENKSGLAEDLKFLASMPELCDITFLVGETREPVCAVKVSGRNLDTIFSLSFPEDTQQMQQFFFSLPLIAGHSRSAFSHFLQVAVPAAGLTTAQEPAAAARSREQAATLPQTLLGAAAESAERVAPEGKKFHSRLPVAHTSTHQRHCGRYF
jgi:hypothetical protein